MSYITYIVEPIIFCVDMDVDLHEQLANKVPRDTGDVYVALAISASLQARLKVERALE